MLRGVKRALLIVAAVVLASTACGGDKSDTSSRAQCEEAYERGMGNALTSDRDNWIESCISEIDAARASSDSP